MKVVLFEVLNKVQSKFIGSYQRAVGKRLYEIGKSLEGDDLNEDRLVPSLRNLTHLAKEPQLQDTNFVAPNATVIGDVVAGEKSSIWYGAILNGTNSITIGKNSVIQDRVHISRKVSIGDQVFIGPNSIIQGSTIHNRAFISMGATVRHATIEQGGFVAAGAVVHDNAVVKQGEIWAGNPARFLRKITTLEREVLREHLDQMQDLAAIHSEETQKSVREVICEEYNQDYGVNFEDYLNDHVVYPFEFSERDEEFVERRIFMKEKMQFPELNQDYEPYRFQDKELPQKFKVGLHEEEFAKVALRLQQKEEFTANKKSWTTPY